MVLGFLGGKDKEEGDRSDDSDRQESPTEEVHRLASMGYSEQEIFHELRERGYTNQGIRRSINKVLKSKVSGSSGEEHISRGREPPVYRMESEEEDGPRPINDMSEDRFIAPPPSQEDKIGMVTGSEETVLEVTEDESIELELLIEEIVDEKWNRIESEIRRFIEDEEDLRGGVDILNDRLEEIDESHRGSIKSLRKDINQMSSDLESLGSRVSSLERAFKEFLPDLRDMIRSYSKASDRALEENRTRNKVDRDSGKRPSASIPDLGPVSSQDKKNKSTVDGLSSDSKE